MAHTNEYYVVLESTLLHALELGDDIGVRRLFDMDGFGLFVVCAYDRVKKDIRCTGYYLDSIGTVRRTLDKMPFVRYYCTREYRPTGFEVWDKTERRWIEEYEGPF